MSRDCNPTNCSECPSTTATPSKVWRSIDSAPKDGTMMLVWDGKSVATAYWGRSHPLNPPTWVGGHCKIVHIDQPTHWMPLPEPPNQNTQQLVIRQLTRESLGHFRRMRCAGIEGRIAELAAKNDYWQGITNPLPEHVCNDIADRCGQIAALKVRLAYLKGE